MDNNDKLRPLYLGKILYERTDEEHSLTTNQLIDILRDEYGLSTHRQTLATEIELLQNFGMDIKCIKSTQNKYHLVSRDFDLAELKLMIDAVDSCKFISKKESKKLAGKLGSLAGMYKSEEINRNITASGKVRTTNEKTCLIIDAINTAINHKCKVSFKYFTYNQKKKKVLKHDGRTYTFSPYDLIWDGDRYYMVGCDDEHEEIRTFRVDRIYGVPELLDKQAVMKPKDFDVTKHVNTTFHMFNAEVQEVTLICTNDTMDSIIDRFGEKVKATPVDDEGFQLTAEVSTSHIFYSWIFGFGGKVRIVGPESVKEEYKAMVKKAMAGLE